jgi:hypothetical protein
LNLWDKKKGAWIAFDDADAQLEFVMIDPYYRIPLHQKAAGKPTYEAQLKTPDKLGVFHFAVNYTRNGFTSLDMKTKVAVRQVHSDEMPRFMPAAIPYYSVVFITILAFTVFVLHLVFSKEKAGKEKEKSE